MCVQGVQRLDVIQHVQPEFLHKQLINHTELCTYNNPIFNHMFKLIEILMYCVISNITIVLNPSSNKLKEIYILEVIYAFSLVSDSRPL